MRGAHAVFAVSSALRDSLFEWLGKSHRKGLSIDVLPNVLPTEFGRKDEILKRVPGRPFTFLAVGNLLPVKGQDMLLQAFARMLQRYPECQLRLIGSGPLLSDLEMLCDRLGINGKVAFLGVREPTAVRKMMSESDALVVSSRFETFGVVVIEALSCGLPVVSTPCGGPQGLLNEKNGVLAGAIDPCSLGEAMSCMVETRHRFDSSAIQSVAHARFGRRAFAERLSQIYEDVATLRGSISLTTTV
jgi:glycosyltransferase involved in cell wall biosynthesis